MVEGLFSQVYAGPQLTRFPCTSFNVSYPIYHGATFDASTTNLSYYIPPPNSQHSPVEITLSFLSPITPTSTLRQSLPASYIVIYVNGGFDIDIYIDINGEWVSGDNNEITWELANTHLPDDPNARPLKTWQIRRAEEQLFTEIRDRGEWGTIQFTGPPDVTHEAGSSALVRQRFSRTGTLQNADQGGFRRILDDEPVFAFSKSFKLNETTTISATPTENVMFTIAHIQDPIVQRIVFRRHGADDDVSAFPVLLGAGPNHILLRAHPAVDDNHYRFLSWLYIFILVS